MKITFSFDTDDENFDRTEYQRHAQADDMAYCLSQITDKLRSWYKYDERGEIPISEVYDEMWDIINENINMERLGY